MLKAAQYYCDLGLSLHWLREKSKLPFENYWSKLPKKSFSDLKAQYKPGMNIGVRLGTQLGEGFLTVIDCDVKSTDPKDLKDMRVRLNELFPNIFEEICVASGRGNGSSHYYILSKDVPASRRLAQSINKVKVFMPSVAPSVRDKELLSEKDIKEGYRSRAAWEISLMGLGSQVVLPPSIHPDSGKPYIWVHKISKDKMPKLFNIPLAAAKESTTVLPKEDFKAVSVDLVCSDLSSKILDMITLGEGVEDRSAALFSAAMAMTKAGFSQNEILSVLTDQENFLGSVAYEHTQSSSRKRAAEWIRKYTLGRATNKVMDTEYFTDLEEAPPLEEALAEKQFSELTIPADWKNQIERGSPQTGGRPKITLKNVCLILGNAVPKETFKRDVFAGRDFYGIDTPWGGVAGEILTDDAAVLIKAWLMENFRLEPNTNLIWEAITTLLCANSFHPVREWLESLPEWDGKERIHGWFKTNFGAVKDPDFYLDDVLRKFLVAAVTRIYEPGHKFDWALILQGEQDMGKSSFFNMLAGDQWFLDWLPDLSNKDAAMSLHGNWIVEMAELASLNKNEIEAVKAFITRRIDKYRPPYGRKSVEVPRQAIFGGSTNKEKYLKDDTGNRRFVIVQVGALNFTALKRDREQLWAETLFIYRNGLENTLRLEGEAKTYSKIIQNERLMDDDSNVMAEQFLVFVNSEKMKAENDRFSFKKFKLLELFEGIGPYPRWGINARTMFFAGKALKSVGAVKKKIQGENWWYFE